MAETLHARHSAEGQSGSQSMMHHGVDHPIGRRRHTMVWAPDRRTHEICAAHWDQEDAGLLAVELQAITSTMAEAGWTFLADMTAGPEFEPASFAIVLAQLAKSRHHGLRRAAVVTAHRRVAVLAQRLVYSADLYDITTFHTSVEEARTTLSQPLPGSGW